MLQTKSTLANLNFVEELDDRSAEVVSGGASISVPTTNIIEKGRARIRVDLRDGLKDKDFDGQFETCSATFDDFSGILQLTCNLSAEDVNSGVVIFAQPLMDDFRL